MKKLNYFFIKIFKAIIQKLLKMYTAIQVKSITDILQQCVNSNARNTLSVSNNSALNKLVYDIDLTTCSFTQIIELVGKKVELRTGNITIKLNSDIHSHYQEYQAYYQNLAAREKQIAALFLILTN